MSNCDKAASESNRLLPFLKWAGGKRWFVDRWLHLIPEQFDRYIEPFVGSGAVFFSLAPSRAVLSDLNADLINAYHAVRDDPSGLIALLEQYHNNHTKEHYYEIRSLNLESSTQRAARLIYLNRTCWNGLYRVNRRNEFNVPIGTKNRVVLQTDDFYLTSERLKQADIFVHDFERTIDMSKEGDFVFVDPPYTVKHNMNGFVKYNDHIFSWSDQVRLRDAVVRASNRGAMLLITNANHESIKDLYKGLGEYVVLERASILAADSVHRSRIEELAIRTWIQ